jgi:TonB family protein
MSTASRGPGYGDLIPRRTLRHPVAVPVDLTVLRSGVPDCIPGRSVNVSEGGLAAVVAGELRPGDSVGVELRLPHANLPLTAKAVVRHQARLRCGLEFVGLSPEQHALIRHWNQGESEAKAELAGRANAAFPDIRKAAYHRRSRRGISPRLFWAVLAVFVTIGALGWWQWYHVWSGLESRLPAKSISGEVVVAKVPPAEMEQLLTHKVDPIYPEAARQTKAQGMVVLDAVIGPDGTVRDLHPVSGPDVLEPAALDAVRWWRFRPYRMNGKPVEVETTVAVEFQPEP